MPRTLALVLTAIALLWSVLLLVAAVGLDRGGPAASVGAAVVYASASRFCHQLPERSFEMAGTQLPVCARCAGLYLSGAAGALLAWFPLGRRASRRDRLILVVSAIPTALTWGLEFAGVAAFSNVARAVAALPLGGAAGWVFVRALRDEARTERTTAHELRPPALS